MATSLTRFGATGPVTSNVVVLLGSWPGGVLFSSDALTLLTSLALALLRRLLLRCV